ncbi:hypothetical protein OAE05_00315 [Gammaproteobacteria bacterium]|nr:hypothetical protein [Gammaproteobacteria bacterium]
MLRKYFSISLLGLLLVSCGGGSGTTPITVEVTIASSAETVQYNESYTISWTSTGSQCYASGGWSGEKSISGSETFIAKRNGPIGYGIECRKNNIFAQAQAVVELEKDFVDSFDFKDEDIVELLEINDSNGARHKISSYVGDFNSDGSQDILIGMRISDPMDNSADLAPRFFQVLGGAELVTSELLLDGCNSSELYSSGDYNLDGFQDVVALPTKTVKTISGEAVDSNICFFIGSDAGLDVTNWNSDTMVDNDSSIDLNNFAVTSWDPVDISGDGYIDLLLWAKEGDGSTAGLPFYIISNTATNPFVQLSTDFINLDPYLPSQGCSQDIPFLCEWKDFYGTSQIYFNEDIKIDLVASACGSELSSCTYTNFTERYDEGNDYNWSASASDVLTPSVNSGQSYSKNINIDDNNLDGFYDLILLENDTKFTVYERDYYSAIISAQDTGDFQPLLSSTLKYTGDWVVLDLDLDNDFDLLAPIDCVEQNCTDKNFSTFEKSTYNSDVSTAAGDITFLASEGSTIITVTDEAHGVRGGQLVTFSGAEGLGGTISADILNGQFTITSTPSLDTYTIESSAAASASDTGNGGSVTIGTYVVTTFIWSEVDATQSINFLNNTINTIWFDADNDNDIDVISLKESRSVVAGTDIPISSTYKFYYHKNDSLR